MTRNTSSPESFAGLTLERLPQVIARTQLSRSEIYRKVVLGDFPKPIKLGERASAWPEHEVTAWIASRIAARDSAALAATSRATSQARALAKHGNA